MVPHATLQRAVDENQQQALRVLLRVFLVHHCSVSYGFFTLACAVNEKVPAKGGHTLGHWNTRSVIGGTIISSHPLSPASVSSK